MLKFEKVRKKDRQFRSSEESAAERRFFEFGDTMIQTPYLLFLGDAPDQLAAKVAQGIKDWRPENAVGQFRMEGCGADVGLTDMSLEDAKAAGAKTLVVGVANRGGVISDAWKEVLVQR